MRNCLSAADALLNASSANPSRLAESNLYKRGV
jgi:hypothetical protein